MKYSLLLLIAIYTPYTLCSESTMSRESDEALQFGTDSTHSTQTQATQELSLIEKLALSTSVAELQLHLLNSRAIAGKTDDEVDALFAKVNEKQQEIIAKRRRHALKRVETEDELKEIKRQQKALEERLAEIDQKDQNAEQRLQKVNCILLRTGEKLIKAGMLSETTTDKVSELRRERLRMLGAEHPWTVRFWDCILL